MQAAAFVQMFVPDTTFLHPAHFGTTMFFVMVAILAVVRVLRIHLLLLKSAKNRKDRGGLPCLCRQSHPPSFQLNLNDDFIR